MNATVAHLFEHPHCRAAVARLIHDEFWLEVPGTSAEAMQQRLALADSAGAVPLCLIALLDGQAVGTVNLVESDDDDHTDWTPWLAGMVVAAEHRGRGIGSLLVRELLGHARRLGVPRVWFGTDGPGFYTRLGAVVETQPREGFWFMRFELV